MSPTVKTLCPASPILVSETMGGRWALDSTAEIPMTFLETWVLAWRTRVQVLWRHEVLRSQTSGHYQSESGM